MSERTPIIGTIPNPEDPDGERIYVELAPESIRALAMELVRLQKEILRDEELITFHQAEKE